MTTEITGKKVAAAGDIFFDAECVLCSNGVKRWGGIFSARGFQLLPLQIPGTANRLGVTTTDLRTEMKLRTANGRVVGGVDAWVVLFRSVWWLWPLGFLAGLPVLRPLAALIYRWIARNRHCLNGHCALPGPRTNSAGIVEVVTLLTLVVVTGALAWRLPAWMLMWSLAFAMFAACKWITFCDAIRSGVRPALNRTLGYLFAWPGMDAKRFLDPKEKPEREPIHRWAWGVGSIACGAALVWWVVPRLIETQPLVAGWMGMIGVVLMLHFGLFLLLAMIWQRAGIAAKPVMRSPLKSTSLAEFWGDRWNTAFHDLAVRFAFRPLIRVAGVRTATLLAFALSGLIHDLLISLPARAGFGLPTLYFLLQGLGILIERTGPARKIGLGRGLRGWMFTVAITAGPACVLFHPWFIHNVILPFMRALGA